MKQVEIRITRYVTNTGYMVKIHDKSDGYVIACEEHRDADTCEEMALASAKRCLSPRGIE